MGIITSKAKKGKSSRPVVAPEGRDTFFVSIFEGRRIGYDCHLCRIRTVTSAQTVFHDLRLSDHRDVATKIVVPVPAVGNDQLLSERQTLLCNWVAINHPGVL